MSVAQGYALVVLALAAGLAWTGLRISQRPSAEFMDLAVHSVTAAGLIALVLGVASPLS